MKITVQSENVHRKLSLMWTQVYSSASVPYLVEETVDNPEHHQWEKRCECILKALVREYTDAGHDEAQTLMYNTTL